MYAVSALQVGPTLHNEVWAQGWLICCSVEWLAVDGTGCGATVDILSLLYARLY